MITENNKTNNKPAHIYKVENVGGKLHAGDSLPAGTDVNQFLSDTDKNQMLFVIGLDIDSDAMGAAVILNKGQRKKISMGEEYTGDKLPLLNEAHELIKQNYGDTGLCCLFGVLNDDVLELLGYGSDDSDLMLDFLGGDYDYYIVDHLENYMKPADKKAWNSFKQNKPGSKQVDFIFYDKPRVIPENYLSVLYPDGAALVGFKTRFVPKEQGDFHVVASAAYDKDITAEEYRSAFENQRPEMNMSVLFDVVIIPALPDLGDVCPGRKMTEKEFYLDKKDEIEKDVKALRVRELGIKDRDIKLYGYGFSSAYPEKLYMGVTHLDEERIKEMKGADIDIMTYDWYLRECVMYSKQKIDAEKKKKAAECEKETDKDKDKTDKLPPICKAAADWIEHTPFSDFVAAISRHVVGQPGLKILLFHVYMYIKGLSSGQPTKTRVVLLAAPSGCGKTETYRRLRQYFENDPYLEDFSVSLFDTSSLTEAGYRGAEVKHILRPLLNKPKQNGRGIVFLDEFDKKLIPSYGSHNVNYNEAAQANLLSMLDGKKYYEENDSKAKVEIDTSNTMFICCGAFDLSRRKRGEDVAVVGFGKATRVKPNNRHYADITREDLFTQGAMAELVGRISDIVNYQQLSAEAIDRIIDMAAKNIGNDYYCEVSITPKMREYLHEQANGKLGCRILDSLIRDKVVRASIEALDLGTGTSGPIVVDVLGENKEERCI